ncbi:MAG: glycosyltransferase [Candidatus Krumholzibacteria bacterium]|jgi:tetratricopeptide (TPR) repeat protein|nr:glycosyltransferase [Candidatus Krumholzibacteria bacterium]
MKRKTVSLCMIARDEEALIGRAIKSALALVDEIVVADTGSRDNTRIIAEGYGARVVDHTWRDDFAAARNAALAAAGCDWILVLDCDEFLQGIRPLEFQRLVADPAAAGYRVRLSGDYDGGRPERIAHIRLFRNHRDVRFQYPVHEQVAPSLIDHAAAAGLEILDAPLTIVHDGGGPEHTSRKRERNLRLLRQAAVEQPAEPYFAFLLGSETLIWLDGDVLPVAGLHASLQQLQSAWHTISAWPPEARRAVGFGSMLAGDLAAALLASGDAGMAAAVATAGRRDWGDNASLCLQTVRAGLVSLAGENEPSQRELLDTQIRADLQAAEELLAAESTAALRGLRVRLHCCRGDLALAEGQIALASEAYEQALSSNQDHSAAWVGLAECARLAGDRKRALRLYLRAVTASEWNVRAWERGCSLMEELGFHDNAQSWRIKAQEQFPERSAVAPAPVAAATRRMSDMVGIWQLLP